MLTLVPPPPSRSGGPIWRRGPGAMSGAPPSSLSMLLPRLWWRLGILSSVRRRGPRVRASILPRGYGGGWTCAALAPSATTLLYPPPPSRWRGPVWDAATTGEARRWPKGDAAAGEERQGPRAMRPQARCGGGGVDKLHQEQNEARERLVKGETERERIK